MTVTVQPAPIAHLPWLGERAKINVQPWLVALEAVNDKGEIVAMVGFEPHYSGAGMMHVALAYPTALRHVLRPAFRGAFQAPPYGFGWVEAFAPVRDDNFDSMALLRNPKFGWRELFHGKDWMGPGVGIVWFGMRREDCRFIGKEGA